MDEVYEIVRTGNKGTVSIGFFQYERTAIKEVKRYNNGLQRKLIGDAARLTGIVRGSNAERYQEIVQKILNPPYSVKPRRLNRR